MPMFSITRRGALASGAGALAFGCSARPEPGAIGDENAPNWRDGPALPFAVQEIYPAHHQGRIHLAGGFISDARQISGVSDQHITLDPETGIWTEAAALPVARHHPALISFQDRLLAVGGFEATSEHAGWIMQSGVWAFDGETWTDAPSLPQPNGESVMGIIEDHLHVCGGRKPVGDANARWNDHSDIGDHFVLTGLSDRWTPAAPLPTPRNSAAAAMIDANWHVVGGRTVSGGNTPEHEVYDASEDRWRVAAPMPQGQAGLAAATVADRLYAFGGEYFENGGGVYAQAWAYDPAADAWSAVPDMPHPRHGLGAVAIGDEIYVIGGALQAGGNQTSNLVEIFRPSA